MTFSAAVFPKRKQNLTQTRCSFKFAIKKSTKTVTEAQEKNHMDPIDLSSRMLLYQLMQRAVTYTHQAGADVSTTPPEKNSRYFWIPPNIFRKFVGLQLGESCEGNNCEPGALACLLLCKDIVIGHSRKKSCK